MNPYLLFIRRLRLLLFPLSLFAVNLSWAGLEWAATSKTISVHPLQVSETVLFSFKNTSDKVVTITGLKPSCGCISATTEKMIYAPGESGRIAVVFKLQGRTGTQHKGLAITTDEQPGKPIYLYVDTTIPSSYEPSVKRVIWGDGEARTAKTIRLTNRSETAFPLKKAVPSRDGVSVELKPIRDGFEYDLIITPSADSTHAMVPIIIHPALPDGLESVRTFTVYALMK